VTSMSLSWLVEATTVDVFPAELKNDMAYHLVVVDAKPPLEHDVEEGRLQTTQTPSAVLMS
jgi:hypothetical protein